MTPYDYEDTGTENMDPFYEINMDGKYLLVMGSAGHRAKAEL
ncbi:MAG: hypothetical protein ACLRMZ_28485 [Blautia marasmi]